MAQPGARPATRRAVSARAVLGALGVVAALLVGGARPAASQASRAATDSLLERAARSIAAGRSIRATFEQTLTNPDIRQTRTARGTFVQQGPSRFAFRFTDPAGDAIVADGAAVWVYLPSSARGQALKLPIAQGAQLDLLTQMLTAPQASYTIAPRPDATVDGMAVAVVQLTPRRADAPFAKATLWIDPTHALVRQLEAVEHSGLVRRIQFRDIRTDITLPAGALTFVVPQDVKVIDASGLLGLRPPPVPRDP